MKKLLCLSLGAIFLSANCKEKENIQLSFDTIEATIPGNEIYEYDLGYFGDEEGGYISRKPEHAVISELKRINYDQIIYQYKPETGYLGDDSITLRAENGSNGADKNNDILITVLKITITE